MASLSGFAIRVNEIKNTWEGTNSRITEAEDRISEVEDRIIERNEAKKERKKEMKQRGKKKRI